MGVGYTTIMYDGESLYEGVSDVGACRYDGIEIGLEKVRHAGVENVREWVDEYGLDCYLVMGEWMTDDAAVDRIADGAEVAADLGADFLGLLPPQRGRRDDETVESWFERIADAAADAGVTPLIHHHGATHVESPGEIREWLDRTPDNVQLVWDTAHYYPYGEHYPEGDVTDGIEAFADDIAYVHLKDVAPPTEFAEHRDSLTDGDFHLDNVINYFRSFTDLGDGVIDFAAVRNALDDAGYDGHYTVEIENRTEKPLVHAKENLDYWRSL
ncbi:sugar phosphate isomerase/epimerase [Halostella sp. JP-L12]|uniref:sugar phosphate isomerase/epimerase family protein n=1 Tax=Halostella TaxID=1843185 RepID=UPI000EF82AC5|nr:MULTISPECIES: sugar phosphate isomerase/epimerase family protein [Halostella]NHN47858.1 sugar phosphate isomerase/epimerase [Halostella sp. JP-L12]